MTFDPRNDGAERCEAFCKEFIALLKKHQVEIVGDWHHMQHTTLQHDGGDPDNGWLLDMQDFYMLSRTEQNDVFAAHFADVNKKVDT